MQNRGTPLPTLNVAEPVTHEIYSHGSRRYERRMFVKPIITITPKPTACVRTVSAACMI